VEAEFSNERSQWKSILSQFEEENKQIKFRWEEEKKKYLEEKNRLKLKITELKVRLKEREESNGNGETELLIKSLKELNNNEEQFSSYENAITFMDRQIKKAAIKISEKDREISTLLEELTSLQAETEHEIEFTKEKSRQEQKKLYDKIFQLEEEVDQLQDQLREKDKYIKKKEGDLNEEKEGREIEIGNLKKIIEEMERDYSRLTSNKKSLEDSYREERENVITSKVDINTERKKKWQDLERQRNQLEIVYREREQQLKETAEVAIDRLKREKQRAAEEREQLRAEVEALRDRLNLPEDSKENKYVEYHKKLATLDLEISLTQNLFKTLSSATARAHSKKYPLPDLGPSTTRSARARANA
jgi:chromosome segregation ATPase